MLAETQMGSALASFRQNARIFSKCCDGLTPEEWLLRPNDSTNNFLWIAGHITWARSMAVGFLGSIWTRPWLGLFARGAAPVDPSQYPSRDEIIAAWNDVSDSLSAALECATEEILSATAPPKSPSFDGKMSGMVDFMAFHETYHVGQAAYLRRWLGHSGVTG